MSSDVVSYLNPKDFYSKLRDLIDSAKMDKMPPAQWVAYIKGLTGKGVKQAEIDDMRIVSWLQMQQGKTLSKSDLLVQFDRMGVTLKEVVLGRPEYQWHSHKGPNDVYQEILYVANSEAANLIDRIEEIDSQMEELSFEPEKLYANPGLATALEAERRHLIKMQPNAIDFEAPHFSTEVKGKHGKNLLFHIRVVISPKPDGTKLFFIDEIQSDWGQSGRLKKFEKDLYRARGETPPNWRPGVPRGPWVSDTKLWAGLALRRVLQRAASTPGVSEVAWIRLCMKNGGNEDPRAEDAKLEAARLMKADSQGVPESEIDEEETDHYYCRLIPKLAEAVLGKSGVKVTFDNVVSLKGREFGALPGFQMTDQAREVLSAKQPLYSAANIIKNPKPVPDEKKNAILRRGAKMLGSAAKIRFVDNLIDLKDMSYKTGSYMNRLMLLALNAKDIDLGLDHESYHCARELFMTQAEINAMSYAFRNGGDLSARVQSRLEELGEHRAARQCNDPEETAAHAFSLWNRRQLDLSSDADKEPRGVFQKIKSVFVDVVHWLAGESKDQGLNTPEKVFTALSNGDMARRFEEQDDCAPERLREVGRG